MVWNISTALDSFPQQRPPRARTSIPGRAELVRAIERMLEMLVRERSVVVDSAALVCSFNALLQQAKEQFRVSDTLRLIEPLGADASVALVAVRLSIVKRTLDAELSVDSLPAPPAPVDDKHPRRGRR